jgi:capsular exopolysaccharide synthesis family protein
VDDLEDDGGDRQPVGSSRSPLLAIWRRRWLVLLGAVVGLVLGALVYAQRPPVYQSSAQVLVVKKRSDTLPVAGGDPRASFYEDYVSTHVVLIRSPFVVQMAVKKRNLASLRSFEGHGDPTATILAGLSAARDVPKDSTSPPNNIINLTYKGADSSDSAAVLAAVIDSYRDFLDETYRNVNDSTLSDITAARDLLKRDIADKQKKYREFLETLPRHLSRGTDGLNVHQRRINTYQAEQTTLLARAGEIRQRLAKIEQARKEGRSDGMLMALASKPLSKDAKDAPAKDVSLETRMHEQVFPLLLKEKALQQDYGDEHPDVLRVREQIAMTKAHFARLEKVAEKGAPRKRDTDLSRRLDNQVEALREELAVLDTVHQSLSEGIEREVKLASELALYENQDEAFRREIGGSEKVLEQVVARLQAINLGRDNGGYDARVIAEPGPGGKVSPIAYQMLLGGLLAGLVLGVGAAYVLELTDKSFRTPEEIRRRLRLPIIGHIPYLRPQEVVPVATPDGGSVELDGGLIEYHKPRSVEAEAYRAVRTALYFNTHGERHKVIQVTSPNMGDGKSTLIANVAVAIAQSGRKVVLLDADLRRPRVHRIFGLTARKGLAQVISGTADLAEATQQTVIPNLSVLPCGARPADPSELLTLPRFADLLEELRELYDYVLVDTPPLLAVSDPCVVAPRVDGVVLTIRVSKNGRPAAERACDMLAGLKAHVYGVVVNGIGKEGAMAGYGSANYQYAYEYSDAYTSDEPPAAPEGERAVVEQPSTRAEQEHD